MKQNLNDAFYQGKNGAIYMRYQVHAVKLTKSQVESMPIDYYFITDFDVDKFNEHYTRDNDPVSQLENTISMLELVWNKESISPALLRVTIDEAQTAYKNATGKEV